MTLQALLFCKSEPMNDSPTTKAPYERDNYRVTSILSAAKTAAPLESLYPRANNVMSTLNPPFCGTSSPQ